MSQPCYIADDHQIECIEYRQSDLHLLLQSEISVAYSVLHFVTLFLVAYVIIMIEDGHGVKDYRVV